MDYPVAGVEEKHHVSRKLADLIAVPHKRFGRPTGSAARERFHILRFDGIVEVFEKLLLFPASPRLQRNLPVGRIADPAGSAFAARFRLSRVLPGILARS